MKGNLPLHHIDTSVILEPHHTEDGRFCRRYLQKVGYNYEGRISLAVYGETLASIVSIDPRITPTDREIVTGAIEDNAVNLVTLDTKLISNKVIEREFDTSDTTSLGLVVRGVKNFVGNIQ